MFYDINKPMEGLNSKSIKPTPRKAFSEALPKELHLDISLSFGQFKKLNSRVNLMAPLLGQFNEVE